MATVTSVTGALSKKSGLAGRRATGIQILGTKELIRNLKRLGKNAPNALGAELLIEGEQIMTLAKKQTPVDSGALKSSGHVVGPETTRDGKVVVTLGFGGPAGIGNRGETNNKEVGYAVLVHENLSSRHPTGNAKYLERPLMERATGMETRIAKGLRRRFDTQFIIR